MPTEPEPTPRKKRPRPKPGPEDYFVFEVDGFAQLTPEQKTWPVTSFWSNRPKPAEPLKAPPDAEGGTGPPAPTE